MNTIISLQKKKKKNLSFTVLETCSNLNQTFFFFFFFKLLGPPKFIIHLPKSSLSFHIFSGNQANYTCTLNKAKIYHKIFNKNLKQCLNATSNQNSNTTQQSKPHKSIKSNKKNDKKNNKRTCPIQCIVGLLTTC
jgi:hypothetical protein